MRSALQHLKKSDPVMAAIIRRVGPSHIEYREPSFRNTRPIHCLPTAERPGSQRDFRPSARRGRGGTTDARRDLKLRPERMRSWGFPAQKTLYIRELAKHTKGAAWFSRTCTRLDDAAVIEHLTQVKGIGVWTAQMFLMFALRRQTCCRWRIWGFARR